MSNFQKWLIGLLAALGIGTAAVLTRPTTRTPTPPPPVVVDTNPVVTTPPTPPTNPSSSTWVVGDSFTQYKTTAAFLANVSSAIGGTGNPGTSVYTDGANASQASIDPTVLYNGHQTLKYTQPGGIANSPELWAKVSPSSKNIWFRAKIRFSPGFTTTGVTPNSAAAYKLLGMAWDTYDGSLRLEITNTTQYQLYWGPTAKSSGVALVTVQYGDMKNITTEWTDGQWYDYIIDLDFTKPQGVARVWRAKDGQAPVLTGTSATSMLSASNPWPNINQVMLGMNFNQQRAAGQNQALWYGRWEAIDGIAHPNPYGL